MERSRHRDMNEAATPRSGANPMQGKKKVTSAPTLITLPHFVPVLV